jgi:hypothetical protein
MELSGGGLYVLAKERFQFHERHFSTIQGQRRLLAKLVPTFANRRCHVVSVTDPYERILGFLDRNRYFFFQAASQLYS